MTESIADKATRYRDLKAALDTGYAELKALEYEIITDIRDAYPDEYRDFERGVRSFKAEGVQIEVKRSYDIDRLQAEIGEDMPELFELVQPEPYLKADGKKLASLWRDAAMARRLEKTLVPQVPKIKVES